MPEDVVVRPATPHDARPFLEMWRGVVGERRYVRTEEIRHPLRAYRKRFRRSWHPDQAQIVAIADGRIVGHLAIVREEHPVTSHVASLGLAVEAGWRGRGVGTALMEAALRWAREFGIEKVVLSVYPSNERAIALYRKFGFTEEGRLVRHSRKSYGYEDEILMAVFVVEDEG